MKREDKERVVAELADRLRAAETLLVADYRGLTHAELDAVRSELLASGARISVVKNTLTRRAAETAGVDALLEFLTGPTAIAFVHDGDMVAVAKTLDETARRTRRLALKGGVLGGQAIDGAVVRELASLPPADVLRGQVLAAIVAPLTGVVALVGAALQDLVGLLDARADQLAAEGGSAQGEQAAEPTEEASDQEKAGTPEAEEAPEARNENAATED